MKVNFFKKIYLFFTFYNKLKKNKTNLLGGFGARVDYICRIYTVLNIPKEMFEEPYNIRTTDIDAISQNYLRSFSTQFQDYLNSIGLRELFDIYEVKKVDKFSYLIVFGFSLFNTKKLAKNLIIISMFLGILMIIYGIYNLIK